MILYIDMDGVVANFHKAITGYEPELETKDGPDWQARSDRVVKICQTNSSIFRDLEVIEGSKEAIRELKELYEIYFLSTPMYDHPQSYTDKRLWLEDHYGLWAKKRLILTHHKDLNIGDFLIDDTVHNGAGEFTGEHIHFGTEKFPNWATVTNYLKTKALN